MKYYLSGPMRGLPDNNHPAFTNASETLRKAGFEVYNPAEGNGDAKADTASTERMRGHLEELLKCDAIVLLPAWGRSEGAKIEVAVAKAIGLSIHAFHSYRPPSQMVEVLSTVKVITRAEAL